MRCPWWSLLPGVSAGRSLASRFHGKAKARHTPPPDWTGRKMAAPGATPSLLMLALLDRPRLPFALLFAVCTALLGFGLYLQYSGGLEPCPMCILQRYAFTTVILVALAGALHGPTGRLGRSIYAVLLLAASLAGGSIAAWQSWIQRFPPDLSECGPDLAYMLESFPLTSALPMIFRGAGECTRIDWTLLGLSIANWSLVCFTLIAVAALLALLRRPTARR